MFVVPIQPASLQTLTLTSNVQHLLIDAKDIAKRHKSLTTEVKHLVVALASGHHGFSGAIIKDLLREQKRGLNLWSDLIRLDPIGNSLNQSQCLSISEQLEWVLREAAYITKEYERDGVGSGEVLLAVARLIKKPDQKEFPVEVTNSVHFQDRVNHVTKKFIFHSNAVHVSEMDIIQKLLGLTLEELEKKVTNALETYYGRYRFLYTSK